MTRPIGNRAWRTLAVIGTIALVVVTALAVRWLDGGLSRARQLAEQEDLASARDQLGYYRWLHPRDPRALLLMAQLLISDDAVRSTEAVDTAIEALRQVPEHSAFAADARTQEGRIHLFLKRQPGRAERLFKTAMTLDKNLLEPQYLLWKLYDLTGRSHLAEPLVWSVVELSPESQRALRLREWYMSQFYPVSANPTLDALMGAIDADHPSSGTTEQRRFTMFRDAELDAMIGHAALARWFHMEGQPKYALEMLEFGRPHLTEGELTDPFLLATYISSYFDLGMYDEATACLNRWPEPRGGYEYWRWKGVLDDDVREDYAAAIAAYDQALTGWPGPADWRTMTRKAHCLTRIGRLEEAERVRAEAQRVERMMKNDIHERLRAALGQLNDLNSLVAIAEFYRDLGRPREAAAWLQLARKLGS